jgi:hypothetical protein
MHGWLVPDSASRSRPIARARAVSLRFPRGLTAQGPNSKRRLRVPPLVLTRRAVLTRWGRLDRRGRPRGGRARALGRAVADCLLAAGGHRPPARQRGLASARFQVRFACHDIRCWIRVRWLVLGRCRGLALGRCRGRLLVAAAGRLLVAAAAWVSAPTAGWVPFPAAGSVLGAAAGYWSSQAADAPTALPAKCSNPENAVNDIGDICSRNWSQRWSQLSVRAPASSGARARGAQSAD